MDCPLHAKDTAEILLDYAGRRLNPEMAQLLERHMDQCEACHAFASAQRQVWDALDAWEPLEVSAGFDKNLFARIEREQSGGLLTRWWRRTVETLSLSWRPALPIGAAVLVVITGLLWNPHPLTEISKAGRHVENLDIEQVESTLADLEVLKQLNSGGADPAGF